MSGQQVNPNPTGTAPDPPPLPREEGLFAKIPPWGEVAHRREPDATRACALGNAVELWRATGHPADPDNVLLIAEAFVRWLTTGEVSPGA